MAKIIDWKEVYETLHLNMDVYRQIDAGADFTSAMILKDEYVEGDSE